MRLFDFLEKKLIEERIKIILRVFLLLIKLSFLVILFFVFFKNLIVSILFVFLFLALVYAALSIFKDIDYFIKVIALKQAINFCKKEEEEEMIKEKRYLK